MAVSIPKKKFKFASLHKVVIKDRSAEKQAGPSVSKAQATTVRAIAGSLIIENVINECAVFPKEKLSEVSPDNRIQILVRKCTRLTLVSLSLIGSIRMEDLEDSIIVLGCCGTSVYLENCTNVTLFVTCHQIRIHKCTNCSIYVMCRSHPIIEDCMGMLFAPYGIDYSDHASDLDMAGLTGAGCWDNVVDFRWHKSTPSPCWKVMPEDKRVKASELMQLVRSSSFAGATGGSATAEEYMKSCSLGDKTVTKLQTAASGTDTAITAGDTTASAVQPANLHNSVVEDDDEDEI